MDFIPDNFVVASFLHTIQNSLKRPDFIVTSFLTLGVIFSLLYKFFVSNLLIVGEKRFFVESYNYEDTNISKIFFLYKLRYLANPSWVMFCYTLFQKLWDLTIIGGIIKHYEYSMIPCILAENPKISQKNAFFLSKQLTKGNKWKLFLLDCSFLGWELLSLFTLGILDILYVRPYKMNCKASLYLFLRRNYVLSRAPKYEQLNDSYLEHVPSEDELLISKALYDDSEGPYTKISYFAPHQYPVFLFSVQPPIAAVKSPVNPAQNYDFLSCVFLFHAFSIFGWLLEIISVNPLEIRYLSIKGAKQPPKKYASGKFADFNVEAQRLFNTRQIMPNEYLQYYDVMDSTKIQPDAMLMIIQYCINYKGTTVRYPYINAVARNWAREGVRTVEDVEAKLNEFNSLDEDMRSLMRALGRRGSTDIEEKQMLVKWTKNWGFDMPAILFAAKQCKNKGGFKKLDAVLDEYYRLNKFTESEMSEYVKEREHYHDLAVKINRTIGVFYDSLDYIIETYVSPWLSKGFDDDALLDIAKYCFTSNVKTLQGMNLTVMHFYKEGCITSESIRDYIDRQIQNDEFIKKVLSLAGTNRFVSQNDREYYRVWCTEWGMPDDLILYAAELSANSRFPLQFINKQLAKWHDARITTLEQAKKSAIAVENPKSSAKNFTEREYTKEQLDSIFKNVPDIEEYDI